MSPQPRQRPPTAPRDMDPVAKAVWKVVMREMPVGIILAVDAPILRLFCESWSRYTQMQQAWVTANSPLVRDRGHLAQNPLHRPMRAELDAIRLLGRELGLTPSARANLRMDPAFGSAGIDSEIGPPPRLRAVNGGVFDE